MPTDASIYRHERAGQPVRGDHKLKTSVTNFRTDITSLQGELDRLNSTRVQMRMDLSERSEGLSRPSGPWRRLGDSASEAEPARRLRRTGERPRENLGEYPAAVRPWSDGRSGRQPVTWRMPPAP